MLDQALKRWRPIDGLLGAGLILQLYRDLRELSLGLLLIWVAIRFLEQVRDHRRVPGSHHAGTVYALFTGLLLIQSRTIVTGSDELGFTQYFLVATGIASGYTLTKASWRTLLNWMSLTTFIMSIWLLSFYNDTPEWLNQAYRAVFDEGYGNINRLGVALSILTIGSWYAARLATRGPFRIATGVAAGLGYITCLATESRMAAIAPLIGAVGGWGIRHAPTLLKGTNKFKLAALVTAILITPIAAIWIFVFQPDLDVGMSGDSVRLRISSCWIRSIFSGNNRFLYGTGHDREAIMKMCSDEKIGNIWANTPGSAGHAHNTFAHIIGLHGLFGFLALTILAIVIVRGIFAHCRQPQEAPNPIQGSWGETCIGINLTLLICALSTTIYIYNHLNQLLIGLMLSCALCPLEANPQPHRMRTAGQ